MPAPRALVIRGGAVGDFILTLPAIRLLREGLPVTPYVEILGYPRVATLAQTAGLADAIRPLEHGGLAPFFVPDADLDQAWQEYFASFTLILSYLFDPDDIFHTNLDRVTEATVIRGPGKIDTGPGSPHATVQLARPLEELALFLEHPNPDLPLCPGTPETSRSTIAIHPGSGSPRKNWGHENWLALARCFPQGTPFLITSGEAEHESIHQLLAEFTAASIPYTHLAHADLPKVARAIAGCRIYIGVDTGITHLAAATGTPTLAIFGPTDPAIWSPGDATVIHASLDKISPSDIFAEAQSIA